MARRWGRVVQLITDAFFPKTCVRCGAEGSNVCDSCWGGASAVCVEQMCPGCGQASLIGARHERCSAALDGLLYGMPYADPVTRGLIRRWKFHYVEATRPFLKRLLVRAPLATVLAGDDWLVVPVPLHARRRRERGFDQAAWVAKTVADHLHLPAANVLERVRLTQQQSRQASRLREDLTGAFRAREAITGRVILCDDVFTSGATMEAAARACRDAGATSVWGVVIAKG